VVGSAGCSGRGNAAWHGTAWRTCREHCRRHPVFAASKSCLPCAGGGVQAAYMAIMTAGQQYTGAGRTEREALHATAAEERGGGSATSNQLSAMQVNGCARRPCTAHICTRAHDIQAPAVPDGCVYQAHTHPSLQSAVFQISSPVAESYALTAPEDVPRASQLRATLLPWPPRCDPACNARDTGVHVVRSVSLSALILPALI
jgi:hypothetical protein